MCANAEAVESTAVTMAKADVKRTKEEVARLKAELQQAMDRYEIRKKAWYRIREQAANALLTALPGDVRSNVIAFLVGGAVPEAPAVFIMVEGLVFLSDFTDVIII